MNPQGDLAGLSSPELKWCLKLNRLGDSEQVRRFFTLISKLGDGVVWYALIVAFAVHDLLVGGLAAFQLGAAGLFTLILYRSLKSRTRRPRPYQRYRTIVAHLPPLDEYSFPSGHTLHAVVFSTIAVIHVPWLAWLLLPFTALIAMSRVVLGLHYPSDVLAASVIGFSIALVTFAIV